MTLSIQPLCQKLFYGSKKFRKFQA
ncbi:hypothetical protein CAEBREN_07801 [Caenorhabditis brenneri]|uniref:Uncharacterized protein n=1 Tax=Caenorhabditis brenneri TaxID=135651 RepID=G0MMA8_CAEBE|nr:hypothetical protein CAEBREN_07801 [Caenorhabditis brenneri]